MLRVNSFDHINLFVKSLENSLGFYKDIFGMQVKEKGVGSNSLPYAIIGSGNVHLALYENGEPVDSGSVNHIGIHISDFKEAFEKLKAQDIPMDYGGIVEYDKSRSIYIRDPDGYSFELSEVFGFSLHM